MRTTLDLDEALLVEAKMLAKRSRKTLTSVIEDALRERLARRGGAPSVEPAALPTFKGNGLLPGVDLDDSAGLLDLMDAPA